jgi:hypothetical protein
MRFIDRRTFVELAGATGAGLPLQAAGLVDSARAGQGRRAPAPSTSIPNRTIREFERGFHGTLLHPSDTRYDAAR